MKHFLKVALVGLASAFSLALAQSETVVVEPFIGGGLSVGVPGGNFGFSLQGGADNVIGGVALRGVLGIGVQGGASLGLDIIHYFPETRQLAPYLGAGGEVFFSGPTYGLHALGGLEYFVDEDVALFAELQPAYFIVPGDDGAFGASVRLGANYHFD